MSEPQPNKPSSDARTIVFMVILSFVCALILSVLASALAEPKEQAKELDRSKQLLIAAKLLTHEGYFLTEDEQGKYIPAKYENGSLVPSKEIVAATQNQILQIYKTRIRPLLVNNKGEEVTFEEAKINEDEYTTEYKKTGYYKQPLKLLYAILPSPNSDGKKEEPIGYVIPVNGMGLWDAIYGYIALKPNGNDVIGISWYDQKETPGLGANISEEAWQNLFPGKVIFQENASGQTDYKTSPLGITVVKGKVSDVYGDSPKSKSAVDGMAGATLTGNGVTDAYRDVLSAYRPFFIKLEQNKEKHGTKNTH